MLSATMTPGDRQQKRQTGMTSTPAPYRSIFATGRDRILLDFNGWTGLAARRTEGKRQAQTVAQKAQSPSRGSPSSEVGSIGGEKVL